MAAKKHAQPPVDEVDAKRKEMMAQTRAFIKKATDQDPVGNRSGSWPHLPSGAIAVDSLIGGTPLIDGGGLVCPGYPRGRLVEIYGAESSGKTTLALAAAVQAQRARQGVLYLDYENAIHHGYARSIGVNFEESYLSLYSPTTLEEGMKMMYLAIRQGIGLVVIDSVAAMLPKAELEKNLNDPAAIGFLARAMSSVLPKMTQWLKEQPAVVIFINQVRANISKSSYGPGDDNTAGGKAVKFYASLRLKLTRIKSEFIEKVDPITLQKKKIPFGNVVQVKAVKNRMDGKQGHTCEIFIRYGSGVDEYLSLVEAAVPRKLVTKRGSAYDFEGESFKGRDKLRSFLVNNPKAFEKLRDTVMQALLSESPTAVAEVNDDDIVSDMRQELDDDTLFDESADPAPEEVVSEGS
jgi:recombination protein RecA